MKSTVLLSLLFLFFPPTDKERILLYNGSEVWTTFDVDKKFIGIYKGKGSGYLELKEDGTGSYKYDRFGFAPKGCTNSPITFQWGFLLKEDKSIVEYKREYGSSIPILLKCNSSHFFKGCREEAIVDFLMVRNGKSIGVSSSDDWIKQP